MTENHELTAMAVDPELSAPRREAAQWALGEIYERDRLRAALTPCGGTKAAYMGEIRDPETKRMVSWTAIKMVMAMISIRAMKGGDA